MNRSISRKGYSALIGKFLELGYQARDFPSVESNCQHLVLRHDIDMSIESAVNISKIEHTLSVSSIYFVLLRSPLYNALSVRALSGMKTILQLGHDIGLHFDASLYASDRELLESACKIECEILEALLQHPITVISFHRPDHTLFGLEGKFADRIHTYAPEYFDEITYCSDSKGAWHHGHPLDLDAVKEKRAIQLLTHPIWWDTDSSIEPVIRLDRLVAGNYEQYRIDLADNCSPYRQAIHSQEQS